MTSAARHWKICTKMVRPVNCKRSPELNQHSPHLVEAFDGYLQGPDEMGDSQSSIA
jgi:hypothetical protein